MAAETHEGSFEQYNLWPKNRSLIIVKIL